MPIGNMLNFTQDFSPDAIGEIPLGHVARAFGYPRNGFTAGREPRWAAITKVVSALRVGINAQKEELATVRDRVAVNAPAVTILSDVRLTDLILWTSQDDRDSLSRG